MKVGHLYSSNTMNQQVFYPAITFQMSEGHVMQTCDLLRCRRMLNNKGWMRERKTKGAQCSSSSQLPNSWLVSKVINIMRLLLSPPILSYFSLLIGSLSSSSHFFEKMICIHHFDSHIKSIRALLPNETRIDHEKKRGK